MLNSSKGLGLGGPWRAAHIHMAKMEVEELDADG